MKCTEVACVCGGGWGADRFGVLFAPLLLLPASSRHKPYQSSTAHFFLIICFPPYTRSSHGVLTSSLPLWFLVSSVRHSKACNGLQPLPVIICSTIASIESWPNVEGKWVTAVQRSRTSDLGTLNSQGQQEAVLLVEFIGPGTYWTTECTEGLVPAFRKCLKATCDKLIYSATFNYNRDQASRKGRRLNKEIEGASGHQSILQFYRKESKGGFLYLGVWGGEGKRGSCYKLTKPRGIMLGHWREEWNTCGNWNSVQELLRKLLSSLII